MLKQCDILLVDEVNCKVTNIDPATIRKCIKVLSFVLPNAKFSPQYRLGRWDGRVSFFSAGGVTQINLLDKILPILEEGGYSINLVDNRIDSNIEFDKIDETVNKEHLWPASHPTNPNEPIILKQHQIDIVNNFLDHLRGIQIVPTSGGKTIITATLSKKIGEYGRSIVIVPNKQLVVQTESDYKLLGLDVGVYFGDRKDWGKTHTIATWQSLGNLLKETRSEPNGEFSYKSFATGVVGVIVDEAHSSKAKELKEILTQMFNHAPIRWGLTGTMPKAEYEKLSIIGSIGPVISTMRADYLQSLGVLSNCEIHILQIMVDKKFSSYTEEHKYLLSDPKIIDFLSSITSNISNSGNTLALLQNIKTGKLISSKIENSVFINGAIDIDDRKVEYDKVAVTDNQVIIATYGVASTGVNIPRVFNLLLIEAGKSFVKTIQSIGRGLRRAHDKDHVVIYDICFTTKYSKRHLTERKGFYKEMGYPHQVIKIDMKDFE